MKSTETPWTKPDSLTVKVLSEAAVNIDSSKIMLVTHRFELRQSFVRDSCSARKSTAALLNLL